MEELKVLVQHSHVEVGAEGGSQKQTSPAIVARREVPESTSQKPHPSVE